MQTREYADTDVHIPSSFEMQAHFITLVACKNTYDGTRIAEFDALESANVKQIGSTNIEALTIIKCSKYKLLLFTKWQKLTSADILYSLVELNNSRRDKERLIYRTNRALEN